MAGQDIMIAQTPSLCPLHEEWTLHMVMRRISDTYEAVLGPVLRLYRSFILKLLSRLGLFYSPCTLQ